MFNFLTATILPPIKLLAAQRESQLNIVQWTMLGDEFQSLKLLTTQTEHYDEFEVVTTYTLCITQFKVKVEEYTGKTESDYKSGIYPFVEIQSERGELSRY